VHRDLKPANVKVRADGAVKVLDFGLARAMEPAAPASAAEVARSPTLMHSPTITGAGTQLGMILGTAAYMAPEQARGGAVDKRADVWAFGVLLWEMLAGRSLFGAETLTDTLAGVLKGGIEWTALPASTPPGIRRLLRRCLARDPRNRLHDVADARIVIDEVLAGGEEGIGSIAPTSGPEPGPTWKRALPWAVAAAALVACATWAWTLAKRASESPAPASVAFTVPWRTAEGSGLLRSVSLSRDGRRLVLWDSVGDVVLVRDLDRFDSRPLEVRGASGPFLSPDGRWLGYNAEGELRKLDLDGGVPATLCQVHTDSPGGAWGADGFVYFTPTWTSGLWRVSEQGGTPERLTAPDRERGETLHAWPSFLPGGRALVFTVFGGAGMRDAKVALLDLASREVNELLPGGAAQYVASGDLLFFRHGAWLAVPFDARGWRVTGAERRVLRDARPLNPLGGRERTFAFADSGLLAYVASPHSYYSPHTRLAWIDREGRVEPLPFEGEHQYSSLEVSPDGGRVAVALAADGELQVWVYDLARGTRERVTRHGLNMDAVWHPDGSRLAVTTLQRGNFDLVEVRADGGAPPAPLVTREEDDSQMDWAPGGDGFVFTHSSTKTGQDVWLREPGAGGDERPIVTSPVDDLRPRLSPDGRWLLYESEAGLYVTDFPAVRQRVLVAARGRYGKWSTATPELFLLQDGGLLAASYEAAGDRFRVLDTRVLFPAPRLPIEVDFAVALDARRFLFLVPVPGKTLDPEARVRTGGFALLREGTE
jgi:serine/threonine-protein kinase